MAKYEKKPLTFEKQADQLLARGLKADREELVRRLEMVNYYRLSGYLYPFRNQGGDDLIEGTTLEQVWNRYCFDRRLRVQVLDAIERIEVAVRTQLVYHFSQKFGPFGHCSELNLPKLKISQYIGLRENLQTETERSKEVFKKHFKDKYGDEHKNLPVWMVCELMSMGSLLTFFKGVDDDLQKKVAKHFGLPDELLLSWLQSLYAVRNICAHHSRLWNRKLGNAPKKPQKNKFPEWHKTSEDGSPIIPNDRVGVILLICGTLLNKISQTSHWHERIELLFGDNPEIPVAEMGLPSNWKNTALWTQIRTSKS